MSHGKHVCNKFESDPTYNAQWSGVSYAPHCGSGHTCPTCGLRLPLEGESHYCPGCDDYKAVPDGHKCRPPRTRKAGSRS